MIARIYVQDDSGNEFVKTFELSRAKLISAKFPSEIFKSHFDAVRDEFIKKFFSKARPGEEG